MGFKIDIRLGKFIWTIAFDTTIDEQMTEGDLAVILAKAQAAQQEGSEGAITTYEDDGKTPKGTIGFHTD